MQSRKAADIIESWPSESREAAQLVIDERGEPDESTLEMLVWRDASPFKRIIATRAFYEHNFPAPHIDAVESVIDYKIPVDKFSSLAEFDGSVIAERTVGEVSARCHDEGANKLALNLVHDIVEGTRSVDEARDYYTKEFLDFRRGKETPYMDKLRFSPANSVAADPDTRTISDEEIKEAKSEGKKG